MASLFEVATLIEGDGHWSAGQMAESLGGLVKVELTDICDTSELFLVTGDDAGANGYDMLSFAIVAHLVRPSRCASGSEDHLVTKILADTSEQALGYALWVDGADYARTVDAAPVTMMTLADAGIATVTGADTTAALIEALDAYYLINGGTPAVVHLGRTSLSDLATDNQLANRQAEYLLTGERIVTNPGYPTDAIGITGPMEIRLGSVEINQKFDSAVNRTYVDANRLAQFRFDPAIAITASVA